VSNSADHAAARCRWVVRVVLALLIVRLVLLLGGADRLTTLDAWSNPACLLVAGAAALCITVLLAYWGISAPVSAIGQQYGWPARRMRIVLNAVVLGVLAAWTIVGLLEVGAQHIGGRRETVSARVASIRYVQYRRSMCLQRVQLDIPGMDNGEICLRTLVTLPLTTATLAPGAPVRVHVVETVLGRVVESIERAR
jgi:hypothetical protein